MKDLFKGLTNNVLAYSWRGMLFRKGIKNKLLYIFRFIMALLTTVFFCVSLAGAYVSVILYTILLIKTLIWAEV